MGGVHWHRGACTSMRVHTRACGAYSNMGGRHRHRSHALAWGECTTTGVHAPAQGADCFQTATEAPPASPSLLSLLQSTHSTTTPPLAKEEWACILHEGPAELLGPLAPQHQGAHNPCSTALLPRRFFKAAFISNFHICHPLPSHTSRQPQSPTCSMQASLVTRSPAASQRGAGFGQSFPSRVEDAGPCPAAPCRSRSSRVRSWGSPLLHCTAPMQAPKSPLLWPGAERGCKHCSAVTPGSKGLLSHYSCCLSWASTCSWQC